MNQASLKLTSHQNQTLTPRLQMAVRLLQMSALDYEQELHGLMAKNPFLEIDEAAASRGADANDANETNHASDANDFGANEQPSAPPDVQTDREPADAVASAEDAAGWDASESALDAAHDGSSSVSRDGAASPSTASSATDLMVAHSDLRQHLQAQVNLLRLTLRERALACAVIDAVDDDGYCRTDLTELASSLALEPSVDGEEISLALRRVQSLEPAGVGARSVGECMLLQLEKIEPALRDTARRIATDHIERLAQRDVPKIAKLLERPPCEVDAACVALRRLDPRPGWRFSTPDTRYITPDVVVRKRRGQWVAQLNFDAVPRLRLNRLYADLFQRHRGASHSELGAHLQEARWTLRNIDQRFATILSVAQAILRRQRLFFEHGPLAMKPLMLRDISQELGIHESTVCRVTNNKYMATPNGLFELKHFFSRAMAMDSGGACSATAIRSVLQELIDAEDPGCPLSDVDITERLSRQGLTIARRTVTKYRQGMKIAPADRRRSHSGEGASQRLSA